MAAIQWQVLPDLASALSGGSYISESTSGIQWMALGGDYVSEQPAAAVGSDIIPLYQLIGGGNFSPQFYGLGGGL